MSNGKAMIIYLIVGLIKRTLYKMSQYFPRPYGAFGENVKIKLDLSSYTTKLGLKKVAGVDTSKSPPKSKLAGLKAEIDQIDQFKDCSILFK